MRIVSWNCNMGFEKKRDVVMSLQPDILVLQECSAKDIANTHAPFKHWVGSNTQKGLAIIGFASYKYTIDRSYTQEWPWFLPVRVEDVPLHILGLCERPPPPLCPCHSSSRRSLCPVFIRATHDRHWRL